MQVVQSGWWIAGAALFDGGMTTFIVLRMLRKMASDRFRTVVVSEALTVTCGVAGMLIKGYNITQMLVLLGLAETAVVLSTLGRVETFLDVLADFDNMFSRRATIVGLRFVGVALVVFVAAIPLLISVHVFRS